MSEEGGGGGGDNAQEREHEPLLLPASRREGGAAAAAAAAAAPSGGRPHGTPPRGAGAAPASASAAAASRSPLKHFAVADLYGSTSAAEPPPPRRHGHHHHPDAQHAHHLDQDQDRGGKKDAAAVRLGAGNDEGPGSYQQEPPPAEGPGRAAPLGKGAAAPAPGAPSAAASAALASARSFLSRLLGGGGGDGRSHQKRHRRRRGRRGRCLCFRLPSLRRLALLLSLNLNVAITAVKLVAYLQSFSLSVLAALLDSVLDILSQLVLNYTERRSALHRSSARYPAGASRLEPVGVLTCAALMGMASFEVLKESFVSLLYQTSPLAGELSLASFYNMLAVVAAKLLLLRLCRRAARRRVVVRTGRSEGGGSSSRGDDFDDDDEEDEEDDDEEDEEEDGLAGGEAAIGYEYDDASSSVADTTLLSTESPAPMPPFRGGHGAASAAALAERGAVAGAPAAAAPPAPAPPSSSSAARAVVQLADPTLEAVAQDHFNDILSNAVAAVALLLALRDPRLWYLDPVGAVLISLYIIYSWYQTGREQIEHLTGRSAPADFIDELKELAHNFDDRMQVDTVRAYHFGPKFLVEIEVVMPKTTLLFESHDVGMELQYEIEGREEVERCFVHIDYQSRPYDEHVVSKVPELREKYRPRKQRSTLSL